MVLSVSGKTMNGKEYPLICRNKIWISIQGRFQKQYFLRAVNRKPYCFTSLQIIAMTLRLAYGADQSSVKQRPAYHHHITSTSEVKVSWFLILPRQNCFYCFFNESSYLLIILGASYMVVHWFCCQMSNAFFIIESNKIVF